MERNNWYTPDDLFGEIAAKYGPFTLDVAADATNSKCAQFYTEEQDALTMPWHGRVWCNPPYKNMIRWVRKAREETTRENGAEIVVMLLPAQTSTQWFHDYALPFAELYWIRGKRKFGGMRGTALMPNVVVVFRRSEESA